MAFGTYFYVQFLAMRRAGLEAVSATAVDCYFLVSRMDIFFHGLSSEISDYINIKGLRSLFETWLAGK
jgi:hypothetical protein